MRLSHLLFGFNGAIARQPFVAGLAGVLALTLAGLSLTLASLETVAEALRLRGIDDVIVLNAIWTIVGLIACWAILALVTKRLHARGRSGAWGFVAVVPLVALAIADDSAFHLGRVMFIPTGLQLAILVVATVLLVWIFVETVFLPSRGEWRDDGSAAALRSAPAQSGRVAGRGGA
jgi:uncharacterized membrane protein YhaH (DUF805 family)